CYRIEQGATATTLKLTREFRNVPDANATDTTAPVTRREFMTLVRTDSWPAFKWTKTDWYAEGQTPLVETFTQGASVSGGRTETIEVRKPGTTPVVALHLARTYTTDTNLGETLTSETIGTTNSATTSFTYASSPGNLGYLTTATLPDG